MTTPAGEPFSFHIVGRAPGNTGPVQLSIAHALDDDATPNAGVESLSDAGIVPLANGSANRDQWLDVNGDGFSRLTLQGAIERDQILVIRVAQGNATEAHLVVQLRVGPSSEINNYDPAAGDYPGILETRTLYSSNSWRFAQPAVARSGDRLSVVAYEGDVANPTSPDRYEMRLQYDAATNEVRGGGADGVGPDSGNWRDHEIAALYNVLAVAQSGQSTIEVKLSFDRGASFGQVHSVPVPGSNAARLVQLAMATNYDLAVAYWRSQPEGTTELVLVEGVAATFDATGSPTSFAFTAPEVVYSVAADVIPMLMGVAYSSGGDLVIGHSFTEFGGFNVTTQYHCAVRLYNDTFRDTLIETEVVMPMDPTVALLGSGADLEIFYAYEMRDGIRVRYSDDAGQSFSTATVVGDQMSSLPRIFARRVGAATRVDLLYLSYGEWGQELHIARWQDFFTTAKEDYRLTTSVGLPSDQVPTGSQVPGAPFGQAVPQVGYRITQVAWFGYDATLDGDEIVVVLDEQTYDSFFICVAGGGGGFAGGFGSIAAGSTDFVAATPPPLAPGMTQLLPAPDPEHMHQLKLLRLE